MKQFFADNLKKFRTEKNISQEQLAQALDVSNQAVSKWECAVSYPDTEMLVSIADFFNITVDALLRENAGNSMYLNGLPDDDMIRILQCRGKRVIRYEDNTDMRMLLTINTDMLKETSSPSRLKIEIMGNADIQGDIYGDLNVKNNLNCGNVTSAIVSSTNINCGLVRTTEGITTSGNINCGNIDSKNNVSVGGNVNCGNIMSDDVSFSGNTNCCDITGNINSNGEIKCREINADNISCNKLKCKKDIHCNGSVKAEKIICDGQITRGNGQKTD